MKELWERLRREHPVAALSALFVAWKSLIGLIVLTAPGVGYDTSTSLLSFGSGYQDVASTTPQYMQSPLLKFVRWDALYFTHMSEQGHVYEQEWAFGVGLSTVLSWTAKGLSALGVGSETSTTLGGVLLSHVSHWLSVVHLWALTGALLNEVTARDSSLHLVAAALHIVSPAGVFLSAPCAESLFSLLSISGFHSFVIAAQRFNDGKTSAGAGNMVNAGMKFFAATVVRSNGILAGIPFLIEAAATTLSLLSQGFSRAQIFRLASVIAGGILVGLGLILPQYMAFEEYCYERSPDSRRPWCNQMLPSIFTFVQSHYWNVGLLRYWTLSNLPLFLLATPALGLLSYSAIDILRHPQMISLAPSKASIEPASNPPLRLLANLAIPQLVLAVLALTSYHVQIITRLSSGYPLWYIWLAVKMQGEPKTISPIIRWMVIYGLIQAGLYACFLPPA